MCFDVAVIGGARPERHQKESCGACTTRRMEPANVDGDGIVRALRDPLSITSVLREPQNGCAGDVSSRGTRSALAAGRPGLPSTSRASAGAPRLPAAPTLNERRILDTKRPRFFSQDEGVRPTVGKSAIFSVNENK